MVLDDKKAMSVKCPGYEVYDWNGKAVYGAETSSGGNGMTNAECPFMVKVSIDDLNIRKGLERILVKRGCILEWGYLAPWKLSAKKTMIKNGGNRSPGLAELHWILMKNNCDEM